MTAKRETVIWASALPQEIIMKIVAALALCAVAMSAQAKDTYVKPYIKKDGTYVEGHYQTKPNGTKVDNYSSKPNTNPYTGKAGTVDPYKLDDPLAPKKKSTK